jgi:hypothetical protein
MEGRTALAAFIRACLKVLGMKIRQDRAVAC